MRTKIIIQGTCSIAILILWLGIGRAGLIDYERLNKNKTPKAAQQAKEQKPPEEDTRPKWMITEPVVKTETEKKYDINRDGKLQLAEVKIYLRDTLDVINEKGGITINSEILKEYDKNKDGVISKYESIKIKDLVR